MKNFIHSHKFSQLDNGDDIIYTRGEVYNIINTLNTIRIRNKKTILITGNSDITIDEGLLNKMPDNIHKWYAQNGLGNHPKLEIIPEGLQPSFGSKGGDVGYEIAIVKEQLLNDLSDDIPPKNLVYANFAVATNPRFRENIKNICINSHFIDWDETVNFSDYSLYNNFESLNYFYKKILNYQSVVCPIGNGIDTHRVYETLYLNRIPITFNRLIYEKLYHNYPVVLLDNPEELNDENLIISRIKSAKNKIFDENMLYYDYWKNVILNDYNFMKQQYNS
jgi:hypothetical protein